MFNSLVDVFFFSQTEKKANGRREERRRGSREHAAFCEKTSAEWEALCVSQLDKNETGRREVSSRSVSHTEGMDPHRGIPDTLHTHQTHIATWNISIFDLTDGVL